MGPPTSNPDERKKEAMPKRMLILFLSLGSDYRSYVKPHLEAYLVTDERESRRGRCVVNMILKTRGSFPSEEAALKLLYLALRNHSKK
jgi:hypothetical protein